MLKYGKNSNSVKRMLMMIMVMTVMIMIALLNRLRDGNLIVG